MIAVLLTFAISSLAATIVFPIFAPLFLSSTESIFAQAIPVSIRSILLGFFLASFPLAQFLFSPIVGEFADRKGRKVAFIITILLEVVGYAIVAMGIEWQHLSLLFIGRFITGAAAANMTICLVTLVDLSPNEKTRIRYFSYGSAVAGVMFVLGPFIGGRLSDPDLSPLFTPSFPMWVGAALALVNFLIMLLLFRETRREETIHPYDPLQSLHNVQTALHTGRVKHLYLTYFFFLFAWNMIYQFMPAVLVEEFGSTSSLIGNISAFMGFVWIVGTICIRLLLHTGLKMHYILLASLVIFALAAFFIPIPKHMLAFLLITATAVFFAGGMWPMFITIISHTVEPSVQGKVMGFTQSIQSFTMMLAPFLGGFLLQAHGTIPFAISALSALIAAALLLKVHNNEGFNP